MVRMMTMTGGSYKKCSHMFAAMWSRRCRRMWVTSSALVVRARNPPETWDEENEEEDEDKDEDGGGHSRHLARLLQCRGLWPKLCVSSSMWVDVFIEDLIGGLHLLIIVSSSPLQPTEVGFKYLVMNCRIFRHLSCVNLSPQSPCWSHPLAETK